MCEAEEQEEEKEEEVSGRQELCFRRTHTYTNKQKAKTILSRAVLADESLCIRAHGVVPALDDLIARCRLGLDGCLGDRDAVLIAVVVVGLAGEEVGVLDAAAVSPGPEAGGAARKAEPAGANLVFQHRDKLVLLPAVDAGQLRAHVLAEQIGRLPWQADVLRLQVVAALEPLPC
jgi:hypothetical protein